MTAPAASNRAAAPRRSLPCPHCGKPVVVQYGLRRLPFRCTQCLRYSAFPLESRLKSASTALAIAAATVLLTKLLGLDKASTLPGMGAYVVLLVGGLLVGAHLVGRVSRATATHLVKVGRPLWFH